MKFNYDSGLLIVIPLKMDILSLDTKINKFDINQINDAIIVD